MGPCGVGSAKSGATAPVAIGADCSTRGVSAMGEPPTLLRLYVPRQRLTARSPRRVRHVLLARATRRPVRFPWQPTVAKWVARWSPPERYAPAALATHMTGTTLRRRFGRLLESFVH